MKRKKIKKIAILTGGGDCPGLNAVIRASTKSAHRLGWEVLGIKSGFDGFLKPGRLNRLDEKDIAGILNVGGTILGSTNRGNPFEQKIKVGRNKYIVKDRSKDLIKKFHKLKLDALIAIGGDGTLSIANELYKMGLPVVGVPKTIDNDLSETVITFGFDTAVSTATDALDKLHPTAESHQRVMVVEVMGRYAGWIALNSGIAGGADVILIPEIPFNLDKVCKKVRERYRIKRNFCIIVVAEGAKEKEKKRFVKIKSEPGKAEVLGGIGKYVAEEVARRTGRETRVLVLGHLQRGGHPSTFDRLLGTRFGAKAVELIQKGKFGEMVCLYPPDIKSVSLEKATKKLKFVPIDSDVIKAGKAMGICFGD
jgi:6-phosphofructokinase 1